MFFCGVYAISGFPPFSGFFSKDQILEAAYVSHVPASYGKPGHGLRRRMFDVIFEADTPAGRRFDILLVCVILLSILAVVLDSVPGLRRDWDDALAGIEWGFTLLFTVEYLARLICVNVLKQSRIALDPTEDEEGRNLHLRRLAELQYWARALTPPSHGITFHVVEAVDPADAIVDFARNNQVDQIVLGARASSALRRWDF